MLERTIKALGLVGQAHLFVLGQAAARSMQQCVLPAAIHGHLVGAALAIIYKLDDHFLTDALDVAITPIVKGERRGAATALFLRTLIVTSPRMRVDFVGGTVHDINAAAVGQPTRHAGREVLIGILDAAIVLVLKFVIFAVGVGIAAGPEKLHVLLALLLVGRLH